MGDLTKTYDENNLLRFFFVIVATSIVSTSVFQHVAGQLSETGTTDSYSEHNTKMNDQLPKAFKVSDNRINE